MRLLSQFVEKMNLTVCYVDNYDIMKIRESEKDCSLSMNDKILSNEITILLQQIQLLSDI